MQLIPRRPLRNLDDLFGRYSRFFNDGLPIAFDESDDARGRWAPSADIRETKKEFVIQADLPEVDKSDINVSVDEGALVIEGERKHETKEEDETYHRVERFYGKFSRAFALPDNVDQAKIRADIKKGVLRVHLPKVKEKAAAKATKIEIA